MNSIELKRIIEALILCHDAPMGLAQIKSVLNTEISNDELRGLLDEITIDWSSRAIQLTQVASGWRFQSTADLTAYIDRMRAEKPAMYSRAVMETLAIIAYRQPVTRGDIEDIRGVTVSSQIIKTLEERGWIEAVGHREVVGRPTLFATTKQFLDDLGLANVCDLPLLIEAEPEQPEPREPELPGLSNMTESVTHLVETTSLQAHISETEEQVLDDTFNDPEEQQNLMTIDAVNVLEINKMDDPSESNKE